MFTSLTVSHFYHNLIVFGIVTIIAMVMMMIVICCILQCAVRESSRCQHLVAPPCPCRTQDARDSSRLLPPSCTEGRATDPGTDSTFPVFEQLTQPCCFLPSSMGELTPCHSSIPVGSLHQLQSCSDNSAALWLCALDMVLLGSIQPRSSPFVNSPFPQVAGLRLPDCEPNSAKA